jgi:hypothetical protein
MPQVQINDGRVSLADGRIVLAIAGDPCCCGPAAAEGYYGATPCSNVCDPSIAPPVLYIPASVAAGLAGPVFGTLAGCYQIDYSVLYWDCVFRGPPPPFSVGVPPYVCAPLDFYRPGRRYTVDRPPLRSFSGCAACFESLYKRGLAGPAACPGENTLVKMPKCPGCPNQAITTMVPPPEYQGELDLRHQFSDDSTFLVPWINIRQVLQDALDGEDGCKAVSVELPSGAVVCISVDVRFMSTRLEEWDGISPRIEFVADHDSCCACHAAITSPDVVGGIECLLGFARPRCAPGVRPDWSLAYRCPPEVPIGKPCCCPGTPCHRRLRIRARRADTVISTGNTTVQVWAGWAPGLVRLHALYQGDTVWTPLPGTPFPQHPACDPMALFQLLGRAGFCGDVGYEVELAAGDCWRASYIERRTDTAGDLYTRIEYYAAFDTQGDGFPFLPELDGVPRGIQSTVGLLGVPVLPPRTREDQCEGIPLLQFIGGGPIFYTDLRESDVVDGNIRASWLACQDGCSGGGGPFPEPGEPGGPFGPGLLRSGGGCGGCGGEGGL